MVSSAFPASLRSTPMNITPELTPKNRYELDQMAEGFALLLKAIHLLIELSY